jgi:hypothetical protein
MEMEMPSAYGFDAPDLSPAGGRAGLSFEEVGREMVNP